MLHSWMLLLFFQYKGAYKNTAPQDMDYSLLLEDEDNLDASPSEPLEITLPKNMDGMLISVQISFLESIIILLGKELSCSDLLAVYLIYSSIFHILCR